MALVRVQDPATGVQFSCSEDHAKASGLTVLKGKDAVDAYENALPPKYKTDLTGEADPPPLQGDDNNPKGK